MQRMLLKKFRPHACVQGIKPVREQDTAKTRDDLIYIFEGGEYKLYKVKKVFGDRYECLEFNIDEKHFARHTSLNFGLVGVFVNEGKKTVTRRLRKKKWVEKCFHVKAYSWPSLTTFWEKYKSKFKSVSRLYSTLAEGRGELRAPL